MTRCPTNVVSADGGEMKPDHHCWYCGDVLQRDNPHAPNAFTIDHVQPRSRGGGGKHNTVSCCKECNLEKANRTLAEYRQHVGVRFFWGERFNPRRVRWTCWKAGTLDPYRRWLKEMAPKRELLCEMCGRDYPIWSADSDLWNEVMRDGDRGSADEFDFVCPTCFCMKAALMGVETMFDISRASRP